MLDEEWEAQKRANIDRATRNAPEASPGMAALHKACACCCDKKIHFTDTDLIIECTLAEGAHPRFVVPCDLPPGPNPLEFILAPRCLQVPEGEYNNPAWIPDGYRLLGLEPPEQYGLCDLLFDEGDE